MLCVHFLGGLPGAGVANIIKNNSFLRDNGVIVYLASPDGPEDPVHKQYVENNLIDDAVFVQVRDQTSSLYCSIVGVEFNMCAK